MTDVDVAASASAGDPIKAKVDKLVARKLHNDQSFLGAVDYAVKVATDAGISTDVDMHTERRLRRALERHQLELNEQFLEEFEKVNNRVQGFASTVRDMHRVCVDITERIQQNKEKTQHLLAKTAVIQHQKKLLEAKQTSIASFLEQYSLSAAEETALDGHEDGTVAEDFFKALSKVREIHDKSSRLLRGNADHAAALEIMEKMSRRMEQAYERLYRAVQRECRSLSSVDCFEGKGLLPTSFSALYERPALFQYALDEFTTARKNHVLRMYLDALTKGGSGAIELLSHDPVRYIGDQLAWMWEAVASERELLEALLAKVPRADGDGAVNVRTALSSALSRVTGVLAHPFKVRVEQTLAAEQRAPLLYRISSIFLFYRDKIAVSLGQEAELSHALGELHELSTNIFYSNLSAAVQKILSKMGLPDYDLAPVATFSSCLSLLRTLLDTHSETLAAHDAQEARKMVSAIVEPLVRAIQLAVTHVASPVDMAVYTLNCFSQLHSALLLYPFQDERLEWLQAQMDAQQELLVSEEVSSILQSTRLVEIYTKAAAHQPNQGPLSSVSGADVSSVSRALASFDSFLARPSDHGARLHQLARISSHRAREAIERSVRSNISAVYGVIVAKLSDPANKYEGVQWKTLEQVSELLKGAT